jgi:hypothetical protein
MSGHAGSAAPSRQEPHDEHRPRRETFESLYAGKAPWDVGRPQPAFVAVADRVTGAVLAAACGTGEHALFFAARRQPVLGIDFLEGPIREARRKAEERGTHAEFARRDALHLTALDRRCLWSCGGWNGFPAAAPCSVLNLCHPRPVSVYRPGRAVNDS